MIPRTQRKISRPMLWLIPLLCLPLSAAARTTYYIDAAGGNDANPGTSPASAWKSLDKIDSSSAAKVAFQPGDSILLKAGTKLVGQIWPTTSGSPAAPIVVSSYGAGARPIVEGDLTFTEPPGSKGKANGKDNGAAIIFKNVQGWDIANLDISNPKGMGGIKIFGSGLKHFHFKNLTIHNVPGVPSAGAGPFFGGIVIKQSGAAIDDILIEDCEVYNIANIGIQYGNFDIGDVPNRASSFTIRNTKVHDCGQLGIILRALDNVMIDHCTIYKTGTAKNLESFGVRLKDSKGSTIQYCEAYANADDGTGGQGFSLDGKAENCILQYNYSHDNEGGFAAVISDPGEISTGNIVRYSISQNDKARLFLLGDARSTSIYNNTLFAAAGTALANAVESHAGSNNAFKNNLFVLHGNAAYDNGPAWDHNGFSGSAIVPADAAKLTADPMLNAPGSAVSIADLGGYGLKPGSPALDAGVAIAGNGGKDFWGNPVPHGGKANMGAYEGQGEAPTGMGMARRKRALVPANAAHTGSALRSADGRHAGAGLHAGPRFRKNGSP